MNILEKYNLEKDEAIIYKSEEYTKSGYNELYINENGKLKHIATEPMSLSILLLFLKKYRANPELLPKNIKHDYPDDDISSEDIYKAMQLMLKPMNSFEEFKERLLLATEVFPSRLKKWGDTRFGERLVFVNKKEDYGSVINIYGELIPILKEHDKTYWKEAILFDRDNKIFECRYEQERTNYTPTMDNWKLDIKFYEEQYLYEYLLNEEISAVV